MAWLIGYGVTIAHHDEVGVSADGHASAHPPGAAAVAPPEGAYSLIKLLPVSELYGQSEIQRDVSTIGAVLEVAISLFIQKKAEGREWEHGFTKTHADSW
jgi:hypothetical protein